MHWLNIEVKTIDSEQFVGSEPTDRATWLCLLRYCAGQENGGRIADCREWADRKWQQIARITRAEVHRTSSLWEWDGNDLVVFAYPLAKEAEIAKKREAANETNRKLKKSPPAPPQGTEENIREGKGIEGQRCAERDAERCATPPPPLKPNGASRLRFYPVRHGLYPREYDAMLTDAKEEMDRIKANPENWERKLTKAAGELVESIKARGEAHRVDEVLKRSDVWDRVALKPQAVADLRAWKDRITEINAARKGLQLCG